MNQHLAILFHIIAALHVSSILICALNTGARAETSCGSAIESMKKDISGRLGGSVTYLQFRQIDDSPFNNANEQVIVGFGNHAASPSELQVNYNLLNSPGLLGQYSKEIISACPRAVLVSFGMAGTGGGNGGWYLGIDNQVRREECVSIGRGSGVSIPWGKVNCF